MSRENILNEICLKNCTGIDCDTPHECSDMCKALLNKLLDKYEKQIRAEVIEECIDTLYEVTPQTIDQKLDMVFVNALKRLKEQL